MASTPVITAGISATFGTPPTGVTVASEEASPFETVIEAELSEEEADADMVLVPMATPTPPASRVPKFTTPIAPTSSQARDAHIAGFGSILPTPAALLIPTSPTQFQGSPIATQRGNPEAFEVRSVVTPPLAINDRTRNSVPNTTPTPHAETATTTDRSESAPRVLGNAPAPVRALPEIPLRLGGLDAQGSAPRIVDVDGAHEPLANDGQPSHRSSAIRVTSEVGSPTPTIATVPSVQPMAQRPLTGLPPHASNAAVVAHPQLPVSARPGSIASALPQPVTLDMLGDARSRATTVLAQSLPTRTPSTPTEDQLSELEEDAFEATDDSQRLRTRDPSRVVRHEVADPDVAALPEVTISDRPKDPISRTAADPRSAVSDSTGVDSDLLLEDAPQEAVVALARTASTSVEKMLHRAESSADGGDSADSAGPAPAGAPRADENSGVLAGTDPEPVGHATALGGRSGTSDPDAELDDAFVISAVTRERSDGGGEPTRSVAQSPEMRSIVSPRAPTAPTTSTAPTWDEQLKWHLRPHRAEISLRLTPESLGRLDLGLRLDSDGRLLAQVSVERPETYQLLEADIPKLLRTLEGEGLSVAGVQLRLSTESRGSDASSQQQAFDRRPEPGHRTPSDPAAQPTNRSTVRLRTGLVDLVV